MMEIVGGIVAIVVGVIMLIIGGSVLNAVTVGDGIGNCEAQDYNGDGKGLGVPASSHTQGSDKGVSAKATADALDKNTAAYKQCSATKNNAVYALFFVALHCLYAGVALSSPCFVASLGPA